MITKLEQTNLIIEKLLTIKLNYQITPYKKDKYKINIKDGFINYLVDLNNLICPCKTNNVKYCNHILFFLYYHLNLSIVSITYLDIKEIFQKFIKYIHENKQNLNTLIEKDIYRYFDKDCIICYDKLIKKNINLNLFICNCCKNELHLNCYLKWMNFKTKGIEFEKGCPFCKNK